MDKLTFRSNISGSLRPCNPRIYSSKYFTSTDILTVFYIIKVHAPKHSPWIALDRDHISKLRLYTKSDTLNSVLTSKFYSANINNFSWLSSKLWKHKFSATVNSKGFALTSFLPLSQHCKHTIIFNFSPFSHPTIKMALEMTVIM